MNHVTSIVVALGLAAAAPAQIHLEGLFGRRIRVEACFGDFGRARVRPVLQCPPPVCAPICVPPRHQGHWQTVCEQVFVPGCWQQEYVPPRYGWIYDACGCPRWGMIEGGCTRRVQLPGHYESRTRQVWVGC